MPENLLTNNKGIALLVTLAVITILVTVSLELNRSARSSVVSSASIRDRMTLTHMATSGIQAGMALLARDKTESSADFLQENWADAEKIAAVLKEIPFETGDLTLTIHDEMGKIQVKRPGNLSKGTGVQSPSGIAMVSSARIRHSPGTVYRRHPPWRHHQFAQGLARLRRRRCRHGFERRRIRLLPGSRPRLSVRERAAESPVPNCCESKG